MRKYILTKPEKLAKKIWELNLDDATIAKKIKEKTEHSITPNAITKWKNKNNGVNSDNIKYLLETFGWRPKDIGVEVVDVAEVPFNSRLKQLVNEYYSTQKDFANDFFKKGNYESKVSKWLSGKEKPDIGTIINLANFFDVSILYLLGQSTIKNPNNEEIIKELGITESHANTLRNQNPTFEIEYYGTKTTAEKLGEKYFEVKSKICGAPELIEILKINTERVIEYYTSSIYGGIVDEALNEINILGQTESQKIPIEIETIAEAHINKILDELFEKFVDEELEAKGFKNKEKLSRPLYRNNIKYLNLK